ncbi:hypothetical protein [Butyrivibrio sp. INlla16]|uniref:hypothetical protein n=1 Tax=Butyrivibrio sp. INlla16 TaxID=1520807 RepID=UPI000887E14E|nr:hypothetical protein [Butyrivibrio sp. INlla16]SDB67647.1 hypothetical protein SAMN02910263_03996 [Butyrivibrio sp. INlla16]
MIHAEIKGKYIILREQKEEDAKFFAEWFNQPEIMFQCGFTDTTNEEEEKNISTNAINQKILYGLLSRI